MTNRTLTQINGEEAALAGVAASPFRSAWADNVIPFPQAAIAALVGFEDEASSFEDPVSIGELAVRIVARWSLPRCTVFVRGSESWEE